MPIFVKSFGRKTIRLEVEPRDTVLDVKEQIKDKYSIPIDQQRLTVGDNELEDGHTLADCNIQKDSTVRLMVREDNERKRERKKLWKNLGRPVTIHKPDKVQLEIEAVLQRKLHDAFLANELKEAERKNKEEVKKANRKHRDQCNEAESALERRKQQLEAGLRQHEENLKGLQAQLEKECEQKKAELEKKHGSQAREAELAELRKKHDASLANMERKLEEAERKNKEEIEEANRKHRDQCNEAESALERRKQQLEAGLRQHEENLKGLQAQLEKECEQKKAELERNVAAAVKGNADKMEAEKDAHAAALQTHHEDLLSQRVQCNSCGVGDGDGDSAEDRLVRRDAAFCGCEKNRHWMHRDCFETMVVSQLNEPRPDLNGEVACMECEGICENPCVIPRGLIERFTSKEVNNQYNKQRDAALFAQGQREEEERAKQMQESENAIDKLVRTLSDEMNNKCPRCKQVFYDYDGCSALVCRNTECKAGFCAFCFKDCKEEGNDAHQHVALCEENPEKGEIFVSKEKILLFYEQRKRRLVHDRMREHLQEVWRRLFAEEYPLESS